MATVCLTKQDSQSTAVYAVFLPSAAAASRVTCMYVETGLVLGSAFTVIMVYRDYLQEELVVSQPLEASDEQPRYTFLRNRKTKSSIYRKSATAGKQAVYLDMVAENVKRRFFNLIFILINLQ